MTLTATPSNNWSFLGWTGDVSSNGPTLLLTMNDTRSVQAEFGTRLAIGTNQVSSGQSLYSQSGGSIFVSPSQDFYPYGASAFLTAVPSNGNYFQNWLGSASFGGSNSPLNFVVTNGAPTNLAAFIHNPNNNQFTLTVEIAGGAGTVTFSPYATLYNSNASVSLTAAPVPGQLFVGWSGDATGAVNPLGVVMNTNKLICVTFSANQPPIAAITNPADGAAFTLPANISFGVSITNLGGSVTNVAYYADASLIGVASNAPFAFLWTNPAVGTNTITAIATATTGLTGTSGSITVVVNPPPQVFAFGSANYFVHESDGVATLTVVNYAGLTGLVNYETANGSAYGGNGIAGDYTAMQGNLSFSAGQSSLAFSIPIIDNYINGPSLQFLVQLLNPTSGSVAAPGTATVTIIRDDANAATNALLTQVYPTNRPGTNGQLTVCLTPDVGGQWRFPWEFAWRNSGDTAADLVAGSYPIEFRDPPGYFALPLAGDPIVTNGTTTFSHQSVHAHGPAGFRRDGIADHQHHTGELGRHGLEILWRNQLACRRFHRRESPPGHVSCRLRTGQRVRHAGEPGGRGHQRDERPGDWRLRCGAGGAERSGHAVIALDREHFELLAALRFYRPVANRRRFWQRRSRQE